MNFRLVLYVKSGMYLLWIDASDVVDTECFDWLIMLLLMKGISENEFWFCPQARRLVIERDMLGPDALEGENFPGFVAATLMAKKIFFFNNKSH